MKRIGTLAGVLLLVGIFGTPIIGFLLLASLPGNLSDSFASSVIILFGIIWVTSFYWPFVIERAVLKKFPGFYSKVGLVQAAATESLEKSRHTNLLASKSVMLTKEQIAEQVAGYNVIPFWQTARGNAVGALLISLTFGLALSVVTYFVGDPYTIWGFLIAGSVYLALTYYIYRGKKWANIAVLVIWTVERAVVLFDVPDKLLNIAIWWFLLSMIIYRSLQVESARPTSVVPKEYAVVKQFIRYGVFGPLFLVVQLLLSGIIGKILQAALSTDKLSTAALLAVMASASYLTTALYIRMLTKGYGLFLGGLTASAILIGVWLTADEFHLRGAVFALGWIVVCGSAPLVVWFLKRRREG